MPASFSVVPSPSLLVNGEPTGSACCVWQDGSGQSYVLSAAHVVGNLPEGTGIIWSGLNDTLVGVGLTLAPTLYWKTMREGGDLDAGAVLISTPGPFAMGLAYPFGGTIVRIADLHPGEAVAICGRFGLVFATFERMVGPGKEFSDHAHGRLLQCRFDPADVQPDRDRTQPGDSGAPIITLPDGGLVGLHVGRDLGGRVSLGVPIEDVVALFDDDLPGFHLRP